jgi:hypothetical protein
MSMRRGFGDGRWTLEPGNPALSSSVAIRDGGGGAQRHKKRSGCSCHYYRRWRCGLRPEVSERVAVNCFLGA